jgi:hypothetical protein
MYERTWASRGRKGRGWAVLLGQRFNRPLTPTPTGLGFTLPAWLTPPKSIRGIVGTIVGAVVRGTVVTVPTPMGTQTFDLGNPQDVAMLQQIASGIKIGRPAPTPSPVGTADQFVTSHVPGGWLGIALVGAGLIFLPKMLRSR